MKENENFGQENFDNERFKRVWLQLIKVTHIYTSKYMILDIEN